MGTESNYIREENLTQNLDFYSELNQKKETVLFSSEKTEPKIAKENINNTFSLIEDQNKSTQTNSIIETKKDKVKYKFIWKQDSKDVNKDVEVLLIGTFLNNWDDFVIMEKNDETKLYEYELYLQRKIHFFKFIVNNKWLCSDLYPTKYDENNNLNNWIDLTNYQEKKTEDLIQEPRKYIKDINYIKENDLNYSDLEILNNKAPKLIYYKKGISLYNKSNQDKIGISPIYNSYNYGNINACYKKLFPFQSEIIGHLIPEIKDLISERNYCRISFTERNKNKLLSLVYYKPK